MVISENSIPLLKSIIAGLEDPAGGTQPKLVRFSDTTGPKDLKRRRATPGEQAPAKKTATAQKAQAKKMAASRAAAPAKKEQKKRHAPSEAKKGVDTGGDSSPRRRPIKKAKAAVTKPVTKKLAPVKKAAVPESPLQVNPAQKARVGRAAAKAAATKLVDKHEDEEELDSDEEELATKEKETTNEPDLFDGDDDEADGVSEDEEESDDDY